MAEYICKSQTDDPALGAFAEGCRFGGNDPLFPFIGSIKNNQIVNYPGFNFSCYEGGILILLYRIGFEFECRVRIENFAVEFAEAESPLGQKVVAHSKRKQRERQSQDNQGIQ